MRKFLTRNKEQVNKKFNRTICQNQIDILTKFSTISVVLRVMYNKRNVMVSSDIYLHQEVEGVHQGSELGCETPDG
jgi:hypothetical protein